MKRLVRIDCAKHGVEEWDVFMAPAPGLAVSTDCGAKESWIIIHVPTGRHLGFEFDGPEEAMFAAHLVADLCDWSQSLIDEDERMALGPRVKAVLHAAVATSRRASTPPTVLNEATS